MRFITLAALLVAGSATAFAAALPKANEYKSAFHEKPLSRWFRRTKRLIKLLT